jgi:hypothetical protein
MGSTMMIKPGVELLSESLGDGPLVQRHNHYQIRLRMWLHGGEPVAWPKPPGQQMLEENETTSTTDVRVDRRSLIAGLFKGIQGMRVGGTRTLRIAPHLAYGEQGVAGRIPANALLIVEVAVISERPELNTDSQLANNHPSR